MAHQQYSLHYVQMQFYVHNSSSCLNKAVKVKCTDQKWKWIEQIFEIAAKSEILRGTIS